MSRILATPLWPRIGLDHAPTVNAAFNSQPIRQANFVSAAMLYDQLVVPTNDFGIVPGIVRWIGLPAFRAALDNNVIRFVRYPNCLAYLGNGLGINAFQIRPSTTRPLNWWQATMFGSTAEAATLQVSHGCDFLNEHERKALTTALIAHTTDFSIENSLFIDNVERGAYQDILDDDNLQRRILRSSGAISDLARSIHQDRRIRGRASGFGALTQ